MLLPCVAHKDIVVVGASAGGMSALEKLAAGLPLDFPASVFVVWHVPPGIRSVLPQVLMRAGPLAQGVEVPAQPRLVRQA